jgi:hypothetical protein
MSEPTDPFGPGATAGDAESAAASGPPPVADAAPTPDPEPTSEEHIEAGIEAGAVDAFGEDFVAPPDVTEPEVIDHRSPVEPTVISSSDALVDDQPDPPAFDNDTPGDQEPGRSYDGR